MQNRINTIVVAGVLGSGKTTVINQLVPGVKKEGLKVSAVVNDIGQLNVDSARVSLAENDIIGYASGCICCERKEDLTKALDQIKGRDLDILVIEPTGAANPLDIIDAVMDYRDHFTLEHVLSLWFQWGTMTK
jgi:G3E family GTPase